MIYAAPGATFLARIDGFPSGLAGTVGVQILNATGDVTLARTTADISESPAGSGSYLAELVAPTKLGQYSVFWDQGTISPTTTTSESLTVTSNTVVPVSSGTDYITLSALKASLNLAGQTFADADLQLAITTASRAIDEVTGRRFYPDDDASQVRRFLPLSNGYCIIDDLCQFTSLTFQGDTWTLDQDFYLEPVNASSDGRPWTSIRAISRPFIYTLGDVGPGWAGFDGRITVTGMWGWAATPAQVQEATAILAARLVRRAREAPFAVIGSDINGDAIRLAKFDPDVAMLIDPFTKTVIV